MLYTAVIPMIHIFDVDYTILKRPSAWYFLCEALNDGIISLSQIRYLPLAWMRYKIGHPNMDFIEDVVKHLAGIEKNVLEQTAEACFERRMKPDIYTGAAKLIRGAIARGEKVLFASSSLFTLIRPLEHFFGIEGSLASTLEFHDGKTSGRLAEDSLFGPRKKIAVETWCAENHVNPDDVCFYSDSYTDLPLMRICGKPVAVNPDRTLAKEAYKHNWDVLRFSQTLGKCHEC